MRTISGRHAKPSYAPWRNTPRGRFGHSSSFVFGPMDSNERRVIHLTLAEESDLYTESIGEGNARRLRVSLKVAAS